MRENVEYISRDKYGNIKKIFQPNLIGAWLLKKGFISPFNKNFLLGSWQNKMVVSNLVTNAGFAAVSSRLNGSGGIAAFTYIAIGEGTTAAAASQTTLVTEITNRGGGRQVATVSRITTTVTNDTAKWSYTFTFTGTVAVTESGIFNAASAGDMLARQVMSAVNEGNGDQLTVNWMIKSVAA